MTETVLTTENGDELRVSMFYALNKPFVIVGYWRRGENGLWDIVKGSDQLGLLGLDALEATIAGLQKIRDWVKETGG